MSAQDSAVEIAIDGNNNNTNSIISSESSVIGEKGLENLDLSKVKKNIEKLNENLKKENLLNSIGPRYLNIFNHILEKLNGNRNASKFAEIVSNVNNVFPENIKPDGKYPSVYTFSTITDAEYTYTKFYQHPTLTGISNTMSDPSSGLYKALEAVGKQYMPELKAGVESIVVPVTYTWPPAKNADGTSNPDAKTKTSALIWVKLINDKDYTNYTGSNDLWGVVGTGIPDLIDYTLLE